MLLSFQYSLGSPYLLRRPFSVRRDLSPHWRVVRPPAMVRFL